MNQTQVKSKQIQFYSYVVCVIVLLYFGKLLENNGLAYFAVGMESVAFFLMMFSGSMPDIIGKMIRYRRKRGQYVDVCNLRRRLLIVQGVISVVCGLLLFFLADILADKLFGMQNAGLLIRILTPLLIIRMLGSLMLGYFQSFGSQIQTAFTSILRPVLLFILGNMFCGKTISYGDKVSALLKNSDFSGMYCAVGFATAVVITELLLLVVIVVFYFIGDRSYDKNKSKEGLHKSENWQDTLRIYGKLSVEGMGFEFLARLFIIIALIMFASVESLGIYYGKYLAICAIPILLACARYYLLYAKTMHAIKGQNGRQVREVIQTGVKYVWCAGVLVCVLLAVLAPQLVTGCFAEDVVLEGMLQKGSILIPAVMLLIYLQMLQVAHKKYFYAVGAMAINLLIFLLLGIVMKGRMESELLAIVFAGWISVLVTCIGLSVLTINKYRLQIEYVTTFVLPLVCVGIVGLLLMFLSKLLAPHIGNQVCFYVCAVLGVVLYLVLLAVFRVFSEREINQIYGKIGRKCLSVIFK